ncbi:MAG: aminopeptidase N [Bacteriovoracia bacterium]
MKNLLIFVSFFLFACAAQTKDTRKIAESSAEEQSNLSQIEAAQRAKRVTQVRYDLAVQLDSAPTYRGQETIFFNLTDAADDLRLDFFQGEIHSLLVNGKEVSVTRTPTFLILKKEWLKAGTNTVKLSFATAMQTNGTGLHRFEDPLDKSVYLYTQFEAFYAHKFMPCFDQPDLKAVLRLDVTAPKNWSVISTTRETSVEAKGDLRIWHFPATAPLSTYLYSLHAGPFQVWEDRYENIPLRLFARPSMAKFVQPEFWFRATKQGLAFYNKFFGYAYPFKKYDQLLVPEFNAGAMENVGAVTFAERFLKRGRMSREDQMNVVSVLLHEMAHMWFGDLVTMRWWNGLWLNESFATYMSALAMDQATPYKESWTDFFSDTKQWAYHQDQLSTTHPIDGNVPDTNAAFSAFDGITYGKGAAVLKQMSRWLSPAVFQKGVQYYMSRLAFQNSELKDFIGSLQKFSPRNLTSWADVWLQQAGVDTIHVKFTCQNKKLEQVSLSSTSSLPAKFRPQSLVLGFYRVKEGKLSLTSTKLVELEKPAQNFSFSGACPDLVYPNYGDHGYLKVSLDPSAVPALSHTIGTMPDVLSRLMLWADLWQMVRDQEISLLDYAEIAAAQIATESNEEVLKLIDRSIGGVVGYWPTNNPAASLERDAFIEKLENIYLERMAKSPAGKDLQYFWWDRFVALSRSADGLKRNADALAGKDLPAGLTLDQDRRWAVIRRLCRFASTDCFAMITRESERDKSDRGQRAALSAKAIFPELNSKIALLEEALHSDSLSLQNREAIASNLFPLEQAAFAERLENVFFRYFAENKHSGDFEIYEAMTNTLSSLNCEERQSRKLLDFLATNQDLPSPIARGFREQLDEDTRCQKIRARIGR